MLFCFTSFRAHYCQRCFRDGFGDDVINTARNSGRPDAKVASSTDNEFLEYQFTADNLPEFTGFVIKVVFSGTNEAEAPRLSDLRAIALA